jgi:hypothetical protein
VDDLVITVAPVGYEISERLCHVVVAGLIDHLGTTLLSNLLCRAPTVHQQNTTNKKDDATMIIDPGIHLSMTSAADDVILLEVTPKARQPLFFWRYS